jgi:hypothetical protein
MPEGSAEKIGNSGGFCGVPRIAVLTVVAVVQSFPDAAADIPETESQHT